MNNESHDPWDWRDIEVGRDEFAGARLVWLAILAVVLVVLVAYRLNAWPFV